MKHVKTFEGFLSNIFGGKKKDEKTASNSKNGSKTVDGIEFDEIYKCASFSGNKNKFYTHHDGTKIAFVSPSYANQNGLNTSGDACDSSEAGY
jgi:hypothetical protein